VEAATGLLFASLAAARGFSMVLPALLYVFASGIALMLIDLDHDRLPDVIVLPCYPVVTALLGVAGLVAGGFPVARTGLSAAVWLAVYSLIRMAMPVEGTGLGEVKLSGVLGLLLGWLGWGPSLVGLLAGFVIRAAGIRLPAKRRAEGTAQIAHSPFMLAGTALAIFAGAPLGHLLLSIFAGK